MTTNSTSADQGRDWFVPFVATLVVMFALQMGNLGFSPLLPSIQRDLSMTFTQLGFFTGMYGLLALLTSVPAGYTAQRFGEKATLLGGLMVVAAGLVLLGQTTSAASGLAARGVWIFGYRFAFISVLVAVAVTCPPSLKGRSMGLVGAISSLASMVGSPAGGMMVREFGWRTGVLLYAGAALVAAGVFALFYRRHGAVVEVPRGPHTIAQDAASGPTQSAFRSPIVWLLALTLGLGGVGQFSVTFFVPSVARDVFRLDAVSAGFIISVGYFGALVANLIIGALMDRFDKWKLLLGMFSIHVFASLGMSVAHLPTFRVSSALVLAIGFSAVNQMYGIAGEVMRGRQTGNVMGVVSLGAGVFGFLGPQLFGYLRDQTGGFIMGFYAVACADVVTLLLLLYLRSRVRPAQAEMGA